MLITEATPCFLPRRASCVYSWSRTTVRIKDASSRSGYRSYSGSIDSTFECLLDELAAVKCLLILGHRDEAVLFV